MHAEMGQARRLGAKLGDDRYVSSIGGDRWYWVVPLNGRRPIYGKIELWIPFLATN